MSKTGQLWCWGKAEGPRGVAWNPDTDAAIGTPVDLMRVGTASNWVKVQIGARHACAINSAGEIWCWGRSDLGQLGQGDTTDRQTPAKVYLPTSGWTDVAVGTDMSCGLRRKILYCWGDNREAELFASGQQSSGTILLPKADTVNLAGSISKVILGTRVCLLSEAGELQCLRNNAWITIPHPANATWRQAELVNPTRTSSTSSWDQSSTSVANYHEWDLCGVRTDGVAQCWNFEDLRDPATLGDYTDWLSVSYRADTPRWPVCGLRGDPTQPTISCFSGYGHENHIANANYGPGTYGNCKLYFGEQTSGVIGTDGCRDQRLNYGDSAAQIAVEPGHAFDFRSPNYGKCNFMGDVACFYGRQWFSGVVPETQQLDFEAGSLTDPVASLSGAFFIAQVARYPEYLRWGRMFALTASGRLWAIGDKGRNERLDDRAEAYPMSFAPALVFPPSLTSVTEAYAPVAGGKRMTVNGSNLIGITSVTVDGSAVSGVQEVEPGTSFSFIAPAHPLKGLATITVTTARGSDTLGNAFTYADPPSAPTMTVVTPGNAAIIASWSTPTSSGDAEVIGYTATASPSGQSCSWTTGPLTCTITGLTNGVPQSISVTATSAVGTGPASGASTLVTPSAVPGYPTYRELTGVGGNTTEVLMGALSEVITIGGNKVMASYNATGGGTVTTRASNCNFLRPNGSGAARTALIQSLMSGSTAQGTAVAPAGCVDFARSSGNSTGNATIIGVPFAEEAVSFAVNAAGGVAREWTLVEVIDIFKCGNPEIHPVLPPPGTGTRSFWLNTVGMTEARITAGLYPCLTGEGTDSSRSYNQENDGRTLKDDEIMPYSMAQYTTQATGVAADVRGKTVLGMISAKSPLTANSSFPIKRTMYTFIPKAQLNDADARTTTEQVFVTQTGAFPGTSLVCAQGDLLSRYGFGTTANCGTPNAT